MGAPKMVLPASPPPASAALAASGGAEKAQAGGLGAPWAAGKKGDRGGRMPVPARPAETNEGDMAQPALCAWARVRNPCSDLARRPLAERAALWTRRLKAAESAQELVDRYQSARAACELDDWRAESRFLQLMQRHVRTPDDAAHVMGQLACQGESRLYLARLLLRRSVDEAFTAAVQRAIFGSSVNWAQVDLDLQAIADPARRLETLRGWVARAPGDSNGTIRLCRALAKAGQADEALAQARRLHERGLMTPLLLREIGDLMARQGQGEEAVRTYSEIVEFDPGSLASRRMLGDIFLGHGWYDAAYRQYRTLTEQQPDDFAGWLRLAASAAGSGRLDEALRLERKVAEAEGTPGPDDPRRWARLMSAARLARAIQSPPAGEGEPAKMVEAFKRKLKELQLFQGPGRLVVVTWEDLGANVGLSPEAVAAARGDLIDAANVGLSAVMLPPGTAAFHPEARARGERGGRPIKLMRYDLEWDGKDFQVEVREAALDAATGAVAL